MGGDCPSFFFFSSRRRHTRYWRDWSSDVCSSDLTRRSATAEVRDTCVEFVFIEDPFGSLTVLFHQRGGALADFLKCRFEAKKLLGAQFREHSFHLPGMLSEGGNNEVLAARGEGYDPNAPVLGALDSADQALRDQAVHGDTNRTWGQMDDRAYRVDGQRPLMEQDLQHSEIRVAEPGLFNTSCCVARQGLHRLQHDEPNVRRLLNALGHKKP